MKIVLMLTLLFLREKRSALHNEVVGEFEPTPFDKARIDTMFKILPRVPVTVTGGKGQYKKHKGNKKAPK